MALGIISIIIGAILFIVNIVASAEFALQQTAQYLGFVCASIFIVGGFIVIAIKTSFNNLEDWIYGIEKKIPRPSDKAQSAELSFNNLSPKQKEIFSMLTDNKEKLVNTIDKWKCDDCGVPNNEADYYCMHCGANRTYSHLWNCKECGISNPKTSSKCTDCDTPRSTT